MNINTIGDLMELNKKLGKHFFDADSMRFFQSRILNTLVVRENRAYFITSEQFVASSGCKHDRRYTIRVMDLGTGDVDKIGEFQQYATAREAKRELHKWRGY